MPSASPENLKEALVGVDPDDTRTITIGGAQFTLGVMSADRWEDIAARAMEIRNESIPRAIQSITARGEDPDGLKDGLAAVTWELMRDREFNKRMAEVYLDSVAHSLIEVSGFVNQHGAPMTFERKDGKLTDKTLRIYERNPRIVERLWADIADMNTLGGIAKKT